MIENFARLPRFGGLEGYSRCSCGVSSCGRKVVCRVVGDLIVHWLTSLQSGIGLQTAGSGSLLLSLLIRSGLITCRVFGFGWKQSEKQRLLGIIVPRTSVQNFEAAEFSVRTYFGANSGSGTQGVNRCHQIEFLPPIVGKADHPVIIQDCVRSRGRPIFTLHEQIKKARRFVLLVHFSLSGEIDVSGEFLQKRLPLVPVRNGFALIQKFKTADLKVSLVNLTQNAVNLINGPLERFAKFGFDLLEALSGLVEALRQGLNFVIKFLLDCWLERGGRQLFHSVEEIVQSPGQASRSQVALVEIIESDVHALPGDFLAKGNLQKIQNFFLSGQRLPFANLADDPCVEKIVACVIDARSLQARGEQAPERLVHDPFPCEHALAGVFFVVDVSQILTGHLRSPRVITECFAVLGYFS